MESLCWSCPIQCWADGGPTDLSRWFDLCFVLPTKDFHPKDLQYNCSSEHHVSHVSWEMVWPNFLLHVPESSQGTAVVVPVNMSG